MSRTASLWLIWLLATLAGATVLLASIVYGGALRGNLLIGKTTSGHHQIELACEACHTSPLGGRDVLQNACTNCHAAELKQARDTHPAKKFSDPRNADRLLVLKADECVTCHREHKPEITHAMGVTLPQDFCALCHKEIGKERPSHQGLAFNTCSNAGCHKFHDNRALYEDFLGKHASDPATRLKAYVKMIADNQPAAPASPALTLAQMDAPQEKRGNAAANAEWLDSGHARSGVNCSGCHAPATKKGETANLADWSDKPSLDVCSGCHGLQSSTFVQGRHGMRLAKDMKSERAGLFGLFRDKPLPPMSVALSRLPMSSAAHGMNLDCNTCHGAHRYDVVKASVEACTTCHNDDHSKAYKASPHFALLQAESAGKGPRGSGVSCATCHMPRIQKDDATGIDRVVVNHNQNDNLRPNEKMIRPVCMDCHGLQFTLNALADKALIKRNFKGSPSVHVESIDWAVKRQRQPGSK